MLSMVNVEEKTFDEIKNILSENNGWLSSHLVRGREKVSVYLKHNERNFVLKLRKNESMNPFFAALNEVSGGGQESLELQFYSKTGVPVKMAVYTFGNNFEPLWLDNYSLADEISEVFEATPDILKNIISENRKSSDNNFDRFMLNLRKSERYEV